ncbi:MAG: FlgD immunoglobulin-like domain containing protein [Candidatus Cloacimonas sp.]|jgi:hypothetical protein|nr:FlgD immunoglobulin-like domain containing protein [Candidatus Cloacimonas sp.]
MKTTLLLVCLLIIASLCLAATPAHPNWVTFTRTGATTGTIRWSSEPSTDVDGYYIGLKTAILLGTGYCDPEWNVPEGNVSGPVGSYTLESPGVLKVDVINLVETEVYYAYVAAVEYLGWSWSAYSSWEPPITLPVELSSFTATLTASSYVTLAWTTQSETNLLGYRVYRSDNQNLAEALMITPVMIPATNTSTVCSYNHEDHEVEANTHYWYWLESIEYSGGEMHGPVSVTVTGGEPGAPILPEITGISDIYPNPFRVGGIANLDVSVKAGEVVSLKVFNYRGQVVKSMNLPEGFHHVNWDGTDSSGNFCSSGTYFYRLSSPSTSQIRKLVLIK